MGYLARWETAKFSLGHGRAFNSAQAMGKGMRKGGICRLWVSLVSTKKTAAGLSQRRLMWTCPNAQAAIQLLMNS